MKPLSAERFALQVTVGKTTYDKLRHAQALLSHRIPSGDIEQVLDRALDSLIRELERRKFAATDRPRTSQRAVLGRRTIPAHVKRAVRERDQDQCAFVGGNGRRCPARTRLEFDHIVPVARGGQATVEGVRLLCRAHNQYEAEGTFGHGFMHEKREAARGARRAKQDQEAKELQRAQQAREAQHAQDAKQAQARAAAAEVVPWLRSLGLRADESRRAAALTETIASAPLEQRARLALTCFGPWAHSHTPAPSSIGRAP